MIRSSDPGSRANEKLFISPNRLDSPSQHFGKTPVVYTVLWVGGDVDTKTFCRGAVFLTLQAHQTLAKSAPNVGSLVANKESFLVHFRRHRYVKESNHHFLISLVAPGHRGARIRIVRIVARVVIPRDGAQLGASLQRH